jgi:hypothetical protein
LSLNAVDRRYAPYVHTARAEPGAAPASAIAAAARDVLASVIPSYGNADQRSKATALLDQAYAAALARVPDGAAKNRGLVAGQAAAAAMLARRANDGAFAPTQYTPGDTPGRWRPHPNPVPPNPPVPEAVAAGNQPALMPQWGQVTPFTLLEPSQFRLLPPPALTSEAYARDYNEVKRVGGKNSVDRTPQQAEIVRYWYEGSGQGWNRSPAQSRLSVRSTGGSTRACSLC